MPHRNFGFAEARAWATLKFIASQIIDIGLSILIALMVGVGASSLAAGIFDGAAAHKPAITGSAALLYAVLVLVRILKNSQGSHGRIDLAHASRIILKSALFVLEMVALVVCSLFLIGVVSGSIVITVGSILDLSFEVRRNIGWSAFALMSLYCLRFLFSLKSYM